MSEWRSGINLSESMGIVRPDPIAEVHVLVYEWARGGAQVQLKLPPEARGGAPNAVSVQAKFVELVRDEIQTAVSAVAG